MCVLLARLPDTETLISGFRKTADPALYARLVWLRDCISALAASEESSDKTQQKLRSENTALESRLAQKRTKCKERKRQLRELQQKLSQTRIETATGGRDDSMEIRFETCVPGENAAAATKGKEAGTETVLKRAVKLYRFVAAGMGEKSAAKVDQARSAPWEFLDTFTRKVRAYIRKAEGEKARINELKHTKGEFLGYIEKEVTELTKSWNLMAEEKSKLSDMLRDIAANQEGTNNEKSAKIATLEREVAELSKKKESIRFQDLPLQPRPRKDTSAVDGKEETEALISKLAGLREEKGACETKIREMRAEVDTVRNELMV